MLQGWRRRFLAALLGLCATACLPPFYALPLLIPAFAGLFLLVDHASTRRQAFLDGWWWGLGFFTGGLYWICISLYVEPEKFAWLTPFALFGLPSVCAVYTGLVTCSLHIMGKKYNLNPGTKIVVFAALWLGAEYLRAHLFSGFPWNLIGYAFTATDTSLQLASVIGVYGLSWLGVLLATLPAMFAYKERAPLYLGAGVALAALWLGFGAWRLHHYPTRYSDIKIRIVQADIAQEMAPTQKSMIEHVKKQLRLSLSAGKDDARIIVWPEAALPDASLAQEIGPLLPKQSVLLTGAIRYAGDVRHWQAWNSLIAIDSSGTIIAQYDKHHLVPFGEYIPLRRFLPVENIAGGLGDFSRGPGPGTLTVTSLPPFSPLICYEAIFPGEATDHTRQAQWLLNITNDAWFGNSTGPYQHLQMARMRAVEQGLPLIRAANTGISASFDPLGRELARIPLGKSGILDVCLPTPPDGLSPYSRFPNLIVLLLMVISCILALFTRNQNV